MLALLLPASVTAGVARICEVAFQTPAGWSRPERRELVFQTGRELNRTTKYFGYSAYEEYAVIMFSPGDVAVLELDVAFLPGGEEFDAENFRRLYSVRAQIEADEIDRTPSRR
jgi:hypothetical protein